MLGLAEDELEILFCKQLNTIIVYMASTRLSGGRVLPGRKNKVDLIWISLWTGQPLVRIAKERIDHWTLWYFSTFTL